MSSGRQRRTLKQSRASAASPESDHSRTSTQPRWFLSASVSSTKDCSAVRRGEASTTDHTNHPGDRPRTTTHQRTTFTRRACTTDRTPPQRTSVRCRSTRRGRPAVGGGPYRRVMRASSQPLTVLVTASSAGIGRAIASRFHQDGHAVVVHGRTEGTAARAAAAIGSRVRSVWGDVTNPEDLQRLCADVADAELDVLIAAAGPYTERRLADTRADDWMHSFRANVVGADTRYRIRPRKLVDSSQSPRRA